ncbi:MAG: Trk family potassium uptake protein [Clostridium sp.]|nr:Trk family potassium uptake protein [Clostridium sp.]MCM1173038.1 Trk family potassium uptake protein [Clostridium sp.]
MEKIKLRISTFQIILLGFILVITVGAILLALPAASKKGGGAGVMDAVFTSTSAVCVTGLVVRDTAAYWSAFGQAVIAVLIQIGGMGVVTAAVAVVMLTGGKIGIMQRSTLQESIAAPKVGGIVRFIGFILRTMVIIELTGAAVMAPVFMARFGVMRGVFYALFHSVSAFCNAGFDLMGSEGEFSSLTAFASQPLINVTVMLLIIAGGLGFLTWDDIRTNKIQFKSYRMQSKIIIIFTLALIILPALYFYFVEFSRESWSGLSDEERVYASLFQAVAPRTAGFNTVDMANLSDMGQALTIILMLIGGSPGSTAGGMKTTTVAVLFASAVSVFRHREDPQCFGRRIEGSAVRNAAAIVTIYLVLFLAGGFVISGLEGLPLGVCLFETASAIGTVGLTLGITPGLGIISRVILIMLMILGRVGGLTFVFAAVSGRGMGYARYPQEKITVG